MNTRNAPSCTPEISVFASLFADDKMSNVCIEQLLEVACSDVDSTLSRQMQKLLINKEWDSLLTVSDINPMDYSDASLYYKDAQLCAIVKKYPYWSLKTDPKTQAMRNFIAAELSCASINQSIRSGELFKGFTAENGILHLTQSKIFEILGSAPPDIPELSFEFGPGAAYSVKYNTSPIFKLGAELDVTPNCYVNAREFLQTCPGWRRSSDFMDGPPQPNNLRLVTGDRLAFVPKNAKTHRPIAVGPLINVLLQKGVGACIRQKLKPWVNLDNSQEIHRKLARESSISGEFATVDLKNASDTISLLVIQNLFPPAWFQLFAETRSSMYEIEGKVYTYQKISAMGNGYTFELESLLFYALATSVCKYYGLSQQSVSVFGDDIIIPTAACEGLFKTLSLLGFEVNSEKSFTSGPFRESCGGDYFSGTDVRPFFLKEKPSYRVLFLFHNYLVRTGNQFHFPKLYRFIRKSFGKRITRFFRTWNEKDDFALLDVSMPIGCYNTLQAKRLKVKVPKELKAKYGVSYLLYRISLSDKQSESDVDWRTERTRLTRFVYKAYRFVHI